MKGFIKYISLILAIAALLTASACNNNKKVPGANTASTAVSSADEGVLPPPEELVSSGPAFAESFTAPAFKTAKYQLVATADENVTMDSNGVIISGFASTYYYDLDITAGTGKGATIKYTITRLIYSVTSSGNTTTLDTNDTSIKVDSIAYFYDLIGKSFTAVIGADGNLASISGTDAIINANEKYSSVLHMSDASFKSLVGDTFYALPEQIDGSTKFTLKQGNEGATANINYSAAMYKNNRVAFSFKEESVQLPESAVNAYGVIHYKSYEPISGTLWISETDRALVEYSSFCKINGALELQNDSQSVKYDVTITNSSSSKITAK